MTNIIETETLLTGKKFSVERRKIQVEDGRVLTREFVIHPGAVTILPVLGNGDIVLIHNMRHAVGHELLELPAGTLEPGEDPADCAGRELEEETGYRADSIEFLCEFYTTPGITNERMVAYVATGLTETQQNLDEGEQIRVETFSEEAVRAMLRGGEFRDSKTIAILATWFARQDQSA